MGDGLSGRVVGPSLAGVSGRAGPGSGTLSLGPGLFLGAGLQLELSQGCPRVRRGVAAGKAQDPGYWEGN